MQLNQFFLFTYARLPNNKFEKMLFCQREHYANQQCESLSR